MKKICQKKYLIFMAFAMIVLLPLTTEAKTHSYQSTYDMTGGVFSKSYYSPTSYITTTIRPKIGTNGGE